MLNADQQNSLKDLAERTKHLLRTGEPPDSTWLDAGLAIVTELAAPEEYDISDQPLILATLHRFVDLADRLGQDDKARASIRDHVDWAVTELKKSAARNNPERVVELIWYIVSYCVTEHRVGGVNKALEYVHTASRALDALPRDAYLELRCRVAYALGRHYQSLATSKDFYNAEFHYGQALELSSRIASRCHTGDVEYALYRNSIVLVGLARVSLSRGDLNRALRVLLVAKSILRGTRDALTRSYVDYLIGSIFRQQSDRVKEAISLLKDALAVFREIRHKRHYLQGRHELAKALLNDGQLREALEILKMPIEGSPFTITSKNKTGFTRWDWDDQILRARIAFELERNTADGLRPLNGSVLEGAQGEIAEALDHLSREDSRATDIRARGLIILGEIALAQSPTGMVDTKRLDGLLDCLTTAGHKPLDRTDIGWGWLVIAEARLRLGQVNGTRAALAGVPRTDNDFFFERKKRLRRELHTLEKGGRWFPPIALPDNPQHWDHYEWRIKNWLMDEAECRTRGLTSPKQAQLLGVPRTTYESATWVKSPHRDAWTKSKTKSSGTDEDAEAWSGPDI